MLVNVARDRKMASDYHVLSVGQQSLAYVDVDDCNSEFENEQVGKDICNRDNQDFADHDGLAD